MRNRSACRWLHPRECIRLIVRALSSAAPRQGGWTRVAALAVSLPLCGNVPYGAVAKTGLAPSTGQPPFFTWTLPEGISPIRNGFLSFDGGLLRPCELQVAIDLDRHIGYRITICNDGGFDADAWKQAKASADRTFDQEVKGNLRHVAVKAFRLSPRDRQTLVCDANALWKAAVSRLNPMPSADGISHLMIRNNDAVRMEGAFTVYTPEGLALRNRMQQLAGSADR